jgi:hypothetical protein
MRLVCDGLLALPKPGRWTTRRPKGEPSDQSSQAACCFKYGALQKRGHVCSRKIHLPPSGSKVCTVDPQPNMHVKRRHTTQPESDYRTVFALISRVRNRISGSIFESPSSPSLKLSLHCSSHYLDFRIIPKNAGPCFSSSLLYSQRRPSYQGATTFR